MNDASTKLNDKMDAPLETVDADVLACIHNELQRQQNHIELIASENFVSQAVLEAQGSIMTNKYAEGYPGARYYGGCEYVDAVERLAQERACTLFGAQFANVQPHSGSQANQAVYFALLQPGDTVLGMDLSCGGHLTHGSKVNLSGKWFKIVSYGVHQTDQKIDYEQVEALALEHRPKMIIAGASAYPRHIDFARFRQIADKVGAYLMVDMAHYAGLIASGLYSHPFPHAHVVTSTTHKTLRGPRGGLILSNDEAIAKKINSAIFPGIQGGPLMHIIAAKAVAFKEALQPAFKIYSQHVLENARALGEILMEEGIDLVTGGTDSHMLLVDLRSLNVTGAEAEDLLWSLNITANKNGIPFDTASPKVTSGIRFGSPAGTTRGFGVPEFKEIGHIIADALHAYSRKELEQKRPQLKKRVQTLCDHFPLYATLART